MPIVKATVCSIDQTAQTRRGFTSPCLFTTVVFQAPAVRHCKTLKWTLNILLKCLCCNFLDDRLTPIQFISFFYWCLLNTPQLCRSWKLNHQ